MRNERVAICFVCLGNICRSPTAEGVFRHLSRVAGVFDCLDIDSAGTAAHHEGERADRRSRQVAKSRGYELASIAREFRFEDFKRFDYVLAMDAQNLSDLRRMRGEGSSEGVHVGLFRDFDAIAPPGSEVPDPYYGGDSGFEEVLNQCERACEGLIAHLLENEERCQS